MAKLCPKGKAAAKRKFKVYPSAYANMYASKVCKGKVRASAKDGGIMKSRPNSKKKELTDGQISKINKIRGSRNKHLPPSSPRKPLLKSSYMKGNRSSPKGKGRKNFSSGGLAKKGQGCEIR